MPVIIAVLLGLTGLVVVIYPLLGIERERAEAANGTLSDLGERERAAKTALREVEFDYTLGNLQAPDYHWLRDRYERRALTALKLRYQREQELDALIEQELDVLRASGAEADAARNGAGERKSRASTPSQPQQRQPKASARTRAVAQSRLRRRRGA